MASSPSPSFSFYRFDLRAAVTVICLCSLMLSPSISDGLASSYNNEDVQRRKTVLGSRPPACIDKCMSCKPCKATLVIPPHQKSARSRSRSYSKTSSSSHRDDDTYYLLSWKCRCGNKLFQP